MTGLDEGTARSLRMSATRTDPVATQLQQLHPDVARGSRLAAAPQPMTAATANALPRNSAAAAWRSLRSRRRRCASQSPQCRRAGPLVHPDATILPLEQLCLVQHLEAVADGRLRQIERVVEGASSDPPAERAIHLTRHSAASQPS